MKKTACETKKEGRIVIVSSKAHLLTYPEGIRFDKINDQKSYTVARAYGQSKLANILHANELARRLKEDGINITANLLHPGLITSNFFRGNGLVQGLVNMIVKYMFKNVQHGAATTCYVALHPQVKGLSGKYFADSNLAEAHEQTKDVELARQLWEFSENLVKR